MYPHGTTPPVLTASEWRDFRTLTAAVTLERPSIVVARHGLDFLTAWYLNTHVAGEDMVIADTDNTYNAHYILKKRQANATSTSGESDGVIIYENTSFTLTRTK